jgi:SPX domain protein involved in polyphosphate accumulation
VKAIVRAVPTPSITHDRVELKYKLAHRHTAAFARGLAEHISVHRFEGKGANRLPRARHYVTTVYFDTASRDLYRAVRENEDNLKIRAREYYDLHPELLELATSSGDIVRYSPVLWVEVKGKQEGRTYKRRVGIPKADVSAFFEHGVVSPAMREIQNKRGAGEVIDELLELRERYPEPVRPSCLVNYRRSAFQDSEGTLRVTLDQRLACFAATENLWQKARPLLRDYLGPPRHEEPGCVLEVKATQQLPAWLQELMASSSVERVPYSKFVTASEAVHGTLPARAPAPG